MLWAPGTFGPRRGERGRRTEASSFNLILTPLLDVLLTFAGHRDPFVTGPEGGIVRDGPVLDLVGHRRFDSVVVLGTPGTADNAARLVAEIEVRHPDVDIEREDLPLDDPTQYDAILVRLGGLVARRLPAWDNANLYVSVASGTPQMHAAWVLLIASGQLPARVLHTRPPRFVTPDKPAVEEVDFLGPAFPEVRARLRPRAVPSPQEPLEAALESVGIVGESPALRAAVQRVAQVAHTSVPLLITGETGTGKELVARLAHRLSGRPKSRLVVVNAAALTGDLVDSALFGHEKGAFTGATTRTAGAFERADGGTLFLDELGELPPETQAKLLRVLQDGTYHRVGGAEPLVSTARIVAATNANIQGEVAAGSFREDLYYRLSTVEVHLPPLRERREDIPVLALHAVDAVAKDHGVSKRLSPSALDGLRRAPWPGNVRDLRRIVTRAVLLAPHDIIGLEDLEVEKARAVTELAEPHDGFDVRAYVDGVRDRLYQRALEITGGNQTEAAHLLGVTSAAVSKYVRERSNSG